MRDESALLQAAAAGDDTARLALADLWEESGDPRSAWARDVRVFAWMLPDGRDPLPALLQGLGVAQFLAWSKRHRISPLEASTFDIEWNGAA